MLKFIRMVSIKKLVTGTKELNDVRTLLFRCHFHINSEELNLLRKRH
ncbi:hypothetical protein KNP414_03869 [Paenibacillus mucilaginosus KNP414]|uniref:Uncharacterized protein n=1 Tax=Paenibacillus mucilaginosus (strain KNP414) TaxID=1036673 RepID=F8F6D3_PAEMK|nr:hypothetical protein KNP414_03869 [Paenibacillus mucilaginosus KNP414]